MKNFINVWSDKAKVFLNLNDISRISFAKDDSLRSSERVVKVQFNDGTTGSYVGHRDLEKEFESKEA